MGQCIVNAYTMQVLLLFLYYIVNTNYRFQGNQTSISNAKKKKINETKIKSVIIYGCTKVTVYSGNNFTGTAVCLKFHHVRTGFNLCVSGWSWKKCTRKLLF